MCEVLNLNEECIFVQNMRGGTLWGEFLCWHLKKIKYVMIHKG